MGDRDFVKLVLEQLGGHHARWLQVAVRPGKPFAFSTLPPSGAPVFGLPGNPVSALVSYELFARPSLRFMSGHSYLDRPRMAATAAVDLRRQPDGRLHLARVRAFTGADGALAVRPSGGQGHTSSALSPVPTPWPSSRMGTACWPANGSKLWSWTPTAYSPPAKKTTDPGSGGRSLVRRPAAGALVPLAPVTPLPPDRRAGPKSTARTRP